MKLIKLTTLRHIQWALAGKKPYKLLDGFRFYKHPVGSPPNLIFETGGTQILKYGPFREAIYNLQLKLAIEVYEANKS